ncbi:MAG TPA: hypothetical protein VFP43_21540 [Mesorhizobium sp.]|nr:hypothetical protein [Mesorhizobium sp.]
MKHQTLEQLQTVAEVHPGQQRLVMTRGERLERWAGLLEKEPDRQLGTLAGTEYQPAGTRQTMRSAGSAITVAFDDAVFRADGLENDTYGEAKRFFELTDWQLHDIVCYCHFGATMRAGTAARRVRAAIGERPNLFTRLRDAIFG